MWESQASGKVIGSFNATIIALIPKKQDRKSFGNRPISCYNVIYKLVSKVLAQRLKPILSEVILKEQFGFLHKRQIHNTVTVA